MCNTKSFHPPPTPVIWFGLTVFWGRISCIPGWPWNSLCSWWLWISHPPVLASHCCSPLHRHSHLVWFYLCMRLSVMERQWFTMSFRFLILSFPDLSQNPNEQVKTKPSGTWQMHWIWTDLSQALAQFKTIYCWPFQSRVLKCSKCKNFLCHTK